MLSGGVGGARWTQIDAIARTNVPWRHVEWRLPCQMNCRNADGRAMNDCRKSTKLDFVPKLIQGRHYPAFRMFLPKHILFSYANMLFPMILHIKEGDFQVFLLFCSLFFLYLEATSRMALTSPPYAGKHLESHETNDFLCAQTINLNNMKQEKVQYGSSSMIMK